MNLCDIVIDKEFHELIPALAPNEFNQLEQNIIEDGEVHAPLILWAGHDILVDGHNRYSILQDHPDIPFTIKEKEFACRDEVIKWICGNQLGRRNISDVQRTILIGIANQATARMMKMRLRDDHGHFIKDENSGRSSEKVAKEFGVSQIEAERSGRFVRGLNEIEAAYPGTTERIKNGDLEVTKKDVMSLTTMPEEDKPQAIKDIIDGKRINRYVDTPMVTQMEHSGEYSVEDYRSELHRKVDVLDKSLELTCILSHKEMLETEEGKDALRDTLLEMTEVLKKYFELC